jgi:ABC-type branched-subunit amino acid transport system ATPase component
MSIKMLNMDLRLKHKSSMQVIGPSMSGKTTFVENVIKYKHVIYDKTPKQIHWFTGSSYESNSDDYTIHNGLPDSFDMVEPNDLVVLDDLMVEAQNSKIVSNLFTRMVHHLP